MGRPKGSTNKKSKTASGGDGREITQHDNVNNTVELTDEEMQALVANNSSEYKRLFDVVQTAQSQLKLHCKRAKAEGVPLAEMKAYLKASTEEGQAELRIEAERAARMARWHNFELGTQASLFGANVEEDDEAGPPTNKSFRSGKEAGMIGDKPTVPNGFDQTEWMRGYHEGQAKLGSAYKTLETQPPDADLH